MSAAMCTSRIPCTAKANARVDSEQDVGSREETVAFHLSTTAFPGHVIPAEFTCDGPDKSPALMWSDPPKDTESFSLIVEDPDAPAGVWVHWVLYGLPADARELPEAMPKERMLPNGARQGRNDFGKLGYNGPCPPRGRSHRYIFTLYALDSKTDLAPGATKAELQHAIRGHVLEKAKLTATFGRASA